MTTAKKTAQRLGFKTGEAIVYPAHGVGRITAIEEQEIAGFKLELFVVSFERTRWFCACRPPRPPASACASSPSRPWSPKALDVLTGRARVKRTMWSRRAQEYEAKINSGDLIAVAEVVRDLYRSEAQPEQSYSERQLYEAALDRIVREISAVNKITDTEALKLIEQSLAKSPRRVKGAEAEGEDDCRKRPPERFSPSARSKARLRAGLFFCGCNFPSRAEAGAGYGPCTTGVQAAS